MTVATVTASRTRAAHSAIVCQMENQYIPRTFVDDVSSIHLTLWSSANKEENSRTTAGSPFTGKRLTVNDTLATRT